MVVRCLIWGWFKVVNSVALWVSLCCVSCGVCDLL